MRVACLLNVLAVAAGVGENSVYIIRHGEKKWTLGCLNDQGQARAQNLVSVFNSQPSDVHDTLGTPTAIFAHWYHDPIDCERCQETVKPLVDSTGIVPDFTHGGAQPGIGPNGGNVGAATAIKAALNVTGGPVLAAWEHVNIQYLTEDLGVSKDAIPNWPSSDYDSVYVLEFDDSQALKTFTVSHQNFNQGVLV